MQIKNVRKFCTTIDLFLQDDVQNMNTQQKRLFHMTQIFTNRTNNLPKIIATTGTWILLISEAILIVKLYCATYKLRHKVLKCQYHSLCLVDMDIAS